MQIEQPPSDRFGEHCVFEQLGLPIEGLGDGFSWKSQDLEHSAQRTRDGWRSARAAILGGEYFLVTFDKLADTVTEMTLVKHAFKAGIPAQRGIED